MALVGWLIAEGLELAAQVCLPLPAPLHLPLNHLSLPIFHPPSLLPPSTSTSLHLLISSLRLTFPSPLMADFISEFITVQHWRGWDDDIGQLRALLLRKAPGAP